eukprot:CAMPEP_0184489404 /NCGR_PEP_ID=MMETSP0113_2-20130426/15301_1 /TAXON_ID=91329 /ORGANISM="Norrisiella sphaerica, Strain BC52" /LENGTH=516 /DNA_ID=CAMNT_0026872793 /DNA_START=686 /DNA_END=2236 /DNA_ORIENTATION=+
MSATATATATATNTTNTTPATTSSTTTTTTFLTATAATYNDSKNTDPKSMGASIVSNHKCSREIVSSHFAAMDATARGKGKRINKPFVLIEAGATPLPVTDDAGIPGALYFDAHELEMWKDGEDENEELGNRGDGGVSENQEGEDDAEKLPMGAGNLKPWPQLKEIWSSLGITKNHRVAVYFREYCLHNHPISACRVIWALVASGIKDVMLLDGGLLSWREANLPTSNGFKPRIKMSPNSAEGRVTEVTDFALYAKISLCSGSTSVSSSSISNRNSLCNGSVKRIRPRDISEYGNLEPEGKVLHQRVRSGLPEESNWINNTNTDEKLPPCHEFAIATTEMVEDIVNGKRLGTLADVRSWKEHTGVHHKYTFLKVLGRIPGSRWARWGPCTYIGGDFWETGLGKMRPLEEIERMWAEQGIHKPKNNKESVVFYCGSGWRSAYAWFISKLLGWENTYNYDGGFLEWAATHPRANDHGIERLGEVECPHLPTPKMVDDEKLSKSGPLLISTLKREIRRD